LLAEKVSTQRFLNAEPLILLLGRSSEKMREASAFLFRFEQNVASLMLANLSIFGLAQYISLQPDKPIAS
jgi:hypothetical protein